MPAENELKYALSFDITPEHLEKTGWEHQHISQGYLPLKPVEGLKFSQRVYKDGGNNKFEFECHISESGEHLKITKTIDNEDYTALLKHADKNGVLPGAPRVRDKNGKFVMTYKCWDTDKQHDIEVEPKISEHEFDALFALCADNHIVNKDRYLYPNNPDGHEWSVDFLYDENEETYFILAEAEMPEGHLTPDETPEEIKPFIAFQVPKGDKNYSNRKLGRVSHAQSLLQTLGILPPSLPSQTL